MVLYVNLTFALSFLFHELHVRSMKNFPKADFACANRARFSVSCWQGGEQIFFQVPTLCTNNPFCLQKTLLSGFANTCEILSLLSEGRFFRGSLLSELYTVIQEDRRKLVESVVGSSFSLKTLIEESSPAQAARLIEETIYHGRRENSRVCR